MHTNNALLGWWTFDGDDGAVALDSVTGAADRIEGNFKRVDGVAGKALKLDGYTTAVVRPAAAAPKMPGEFTIEAWIALGAYPWNFCPVAAQGEDGQTGYNFSVGPRGEVRVGVSTSGQWVQCCSNNFAVELRKWTHVACTCGPDGALAVYVDGKLAATAAPSAAPSFASDADLWIGANSHAVRPSNHRGEAGTRPSWFCLDGMLDELKIHGRAQTSEQIAAAFGAVRPAPQQELKPRRMPSGPEGPGPFGAYYCNLKYYDEWDALWPVGPHPDVLVRFDRSPVRVVFWRGTRFSPAWVSENGLWMADQSVEAWDNIEGCYEHMQDRHCHYSHVRIIESHEARAVVHWRYAPTSSHDHHWRVDPKTGWGCWVDEYYYFYPDATGIRKVTWKTGSLGEPHQFQESLPFTQPGQVQGDVVQAEYATVVNLAGQTGTLRYTQNPSDKPVEGMPADSLVQRYNFHSQNKPFILFEVGNEMHFGKERAMERLKMPGTCNHWPVCQMRSDGRDSQAADRPAHFLGHPISYAPVHEADGRKWWHGLYGMGDQPMERLIFIAKSWNYPPPMTIARGPFAGGDYDMSQRAYVLNRSGAADAPLKCTLAASRDRPAFNPVLVIRGWGDADAAVGINGRTASRGTQFRAGHCRGLEGTDLVIWLALETTEAVDLKVSPPSGKAGC